MAKVKKKRKAEKGQDGWLDNLLRFEIVVLLFALIGFYYFLSFSPIRMPKEPIASPRVSLAPLPPASEPVVSVHEESSRLVDDAELPVSSVEASVPVVKELDSGSRQDGVTVSPEVAEANLSDKKDEKFPAAVGLQKAVSPKGVKPQSVEAVALDPTPLAEPVSVTARTLPASGSSVVSQVVEVGSYLLRSDLQKFRSQLEALGFIVKTETRKCLTPMYRVFLGPYPRLQKAKKMIGVARGLGDKPFLKRQEDGYAVIVGSFYLETSVVTWKNMYNAAGLEPTVKKESLLMPHTLLLLDGPKVAQNPEEVLARVQAAGFTQAFLRTISPTSAK